MNSLKDKLMNMVSQYLFEARTTLCLVTIPILSVLKCLNLNELRENIRLAYRKLFPSLEWLNETYWLNVLIFVSIGVYLSYFARRKYCEKKKEKPDYKEIEAVNKSEHTLYFIINMWILGYILGLDFDMAKMLLLLVGGAIVIAGVVEVWWRVH